jgi:hypothetical protein
LWQPSKTEVLATTIPNQNAHLHLASPQSFSSACIPFSTIRSNLSSGLTSWVQSLAVKVQVSSSPKVSCHVFTLLPFELVTSITQISSAKTALKATAEMQPSADSNKTCNASSFDNKSYSTFQLVVVSVDWLSKAFSNKLFRTLRLDGIKSKMPFTFQLIFGSKQIHQTKLQQVLVNAWFPNTISGHGPNSHKPSCASQLAAHSKYLKSHETSCVFQLAAHAKCLRSQASCIAFGTLVCPFAASTNIIKADSDVSNLLFQIFINIEADSNFIQYLSSILWQMNKMCSTSQMVANGHQFIIRASSSTAQLPLFTKPNKYFRLVVEFIIPNSEGECYVSKSTFGLIVESILIQNDLINRIFEVAAVVRAFIYDTPGASAFKSRIGYSKISLVFGIDCKIFCEGVKGNAVVEQKSENTEANCSILPFPSISTTVAMAKPNVRAQVNVVPLKTTATENMCASAIKCSSGLVGRIDRISLNGLKLVDLVGCTNLVSQIKLISLVGHIGLIGLNDFVECILVG